jgi:ribonuclease D
MLMTAAPSIWVRTEDELADLVDTLSRSRAIAIDIEADSLHHYTEKVCLIQVAAFGGVSRLVDPLALRDLSPLAPILSDPSIVKVVHGGDNDVTSLRRDFGFSFRTMFDTSIAARLLGDTELGLQALVRNELGIELSKGSQKDDWSKRPLTAKQETYALSDVAHLMDLATVLTGRLADAKRTEWAREEFAELSNLPPGVKRTGPDDFRRIKGAGKLSPRKQAVLRELWMWREARAAAADRPPFKIVGPEVLLALAEKPPTSVDQVAKALSPYARQAREVDVVFAAIERALGLPDSELPAREQGQRTVVPASVRARLVALRHWRDTQAAASKLDPSTVMPLRLIERIAAAGPTTLAELAAIDGIRQWRVTEWGRALLAACG